MTLRGGERPGIDSLSRVRPGRDRWDVACLAPQRCREVRASGVRSTDEEHSAGTACADWRDVRRRVVGQLDVSTAVVALGSTAYDEALRFEHVEMMRKQVGRHRERAGQLRGRCIAGTQNVDDLQPCRIGQRPIDRRAAFELPSLPSVHCLNID